MSLNSINKFLIDHRLWIAISFVLMGWYLSPLFYNTFYVPIYDNLDSNVVWFKLLAQSGMIFADNSAIVPNMMNGLPRSTYGSEFNIILWFYYFFEPKTAFIINEISIHLVAFFSMFIFLKKYIVKKNLYYKNVPLYVGALYFGLLPYWSGAGLSIAILPLVTYSLLNIKRHVDSKFDWILLLLLPLYSSFIFLYIFYIMMAGFYMFWDAWKHHQINKRFFLALLLMGTLFLLSEYRLVIAMFFDNGFISHRVEFNLFFKEDLLECYRLSLVNFLIGHLPHAQSLQANILPIILISLLLSFIRRRLSQKESLVVWGLIVLSFLVDIWTVVLIHKFTLPVIFLLSLWVFFTQKRYQKLPLLLLFIIVLSVIATIFEYKGFKWVTIYLPILNALNMIRMLFMEPLLYTTVFVLALILIFRKLHFTLIATLLFIIWQFNYSYTQSFYQTQPQEGYASFESYYAPKTFDRLKKELNIIASSQREKINFISYGMEPAVSLFNGLHTIDGYSTNYPLSYKHQFKKIFAHYNYDKLIYDGWGSKAYILTVPNLAKHYHKGLIIEQLRFDVQTLCQLKTDYILSPYYFNDSSFSKTLKLQTSIKGEENSWDLYLYKIHCH